MRNRTTAPDRDRSATDPSPERFLDAVFDLLSSTPRRLVLHLVVDRDGPVALAELAEAVVGVAGDADDRSGHVTGSNADVVEVDDVDGESGASEARERAVVSLHHAHLPKLAASGAIRYDPDRRVAAPGPALNRIGPFLAHIRRDE